MTGKIKYITSHLPGSITLVDGTVVIFVPPGDERGDDPERGQGGVREPRKPKPRRPSGSAAKAPEAEREQVQV